MNFLLIGHSNYGECLYNTVNFFKNDIPNVYYINDSNRVENEFVNFLDANKEPLIIFTDLLGGSVNALAMKYLPVNSYKLISGANVSMVLECIFSEPSDDETIRAIVEQARAGLVYVNEMMKGL